MNTRIFQQGNCTIVSLVPGLTIKNENGDDQIAGLNGLLLHGPQSCRKYANAVLSLATSWIDHHIIKNGTAIPPLIRKDRQHGLLVVQDQLILTIISPGRDAIATSLVITGVESWIDFANALLDAAERMNAPTTKTSIPVISHWKTTRKPTQQKRELQCLHD